MDHVEMALQDNAKSIFHAGSRGFSDDHISDVIDDRFQVQFLPKFSHEFNYAFLSLGWTGNSVQVFKVGPDSRRVQFGYSFIHGVCF